jgi:hypothetical protein
MACAAILLITLVYPMSSDTAVQVYIGDLWLRGLWPYTGSWDHNFPGTPVIHMLQLLTFGRSAAALHSFDIVWQLGTAALIYATTKRFAPSSAAWLASVMYIVHYVVGGFTATCQKDTFAPLFIILAVYLLLGDRITTQRLLIAGLSIGFAILIRPTYGIAVFVSPLFIPILHRKYTRDLLRLFTGVAILFSAFLAPYILAGDLHEVLASALLFNFTVYSGQTLSGYWLGILSSTWWFWVPGLISLALTYRRQERSPLPLLIMSAALYSSLFVLQRFDYHFYPFVVFVVMLSAIGLDKLLRSDLLKLVAYPTLSLVMLYILLAGTTTSAAIRSVLSGSTLQQAQESYDPVQWGIRDSRMLADYLKRNSGEFDRVQVIGPPDAALEARVQPASRFIVLHAFSLGAADAPLTPDQARWKNEFEETLTTKQPKYIVVFRGDPSGLRFHRGLYQREYIRQHLPRVDVMLQERYRVDTLFSLFEVHKRSE